MTWWTYFWKARVENLGIPKRRPTTAFFDDGQRSSDQKKVHKHDGCKICANEKPSGPRRK